MKYINEILQGDSLTRLKDIDSESINCIVTSPPYWALRDYKTEGQIGIEKTIDEYINNLIKVFDECKRVLKKTGTCWVVLGDTYAGTGHKGDYKDPKYENGRNGQEIALNNKIEGIKDKSLCMIPQRFAIRMVDYGWICRCIPIWQKPNCMPSSAKDRFTVDYEFIHFFTKSQKYYFKTQYEPLSPVTIEEVKKFYNGKGRKDYEGNKVQNPSNVKRSIIKKFAPIGGVKHVGESNATYSDNEYNPNIEIGRIKRCIWSIPTKPFPDAHFAVFPEELVKQCISAGCPEDGIVLDCFMGSGTTALVALKNNRKFMGIELNEDYIKIANKRIEPYLNQMKLFT